MSRRVTERIKAREAQFSRKPSYPEAGALAEVAEEIRSMAEPRSEVVKKPRTKKAK